MQCCLWQGEPQWLVQTVAIISTYLFPQNKQVGKCEEPPLSPSLIGLALQYPIGSQIQKRSKLN